MAAALDPVPTWQEVREKFDHPVIATLEKLVGTGTKTAGAKRFFGWVATSETSEAEWMRSYVANDNRDVDSHATVGAIRGAILRWVDSLQELGIWKSGSIRAQRDHLLKALEKLREFDPGSFPSIDPRSMPMGAHHDGGNFTTLSALDWPEFEGVEPERRDAVALSVLRGAALEVFERYEKIYQFGQRVLGDDCSGVKNKRAVKTLRRLIGDEISSWEKTGRSQFSIRWSVSLSDGIDQLRDPEIWRSFGLYVWGNRDNLQPTAVADLVLACVGPTFRANQAVQVIFCADTGWNRQPIQELPRHPYAFRTDSSVLLGSEKVLTNFKNRAGHMVHAGTEMTAVVRGIAELDLKSHWEDVANELRLSKADEQASMAHEAPLIQILDRFEKLQSLSRAWAKGETESLFFYVLSQRTGSVVKANRDPGLLMPEGPLTRKGATFSAMRKSFLNTLSTAGFEPSFIAEIAGHRSRSVLAKNYFVDQQAARTYEDSVRVIQGCIQELILNKRLALRLNINDETRDHFRMVALHTGVMSAAGLTPLELDGEVTDDFVFEPTFSGLIDLYLCHRGLKKQRWELPHHRWVIQGQALMAIIKGLGRTVFAKGLGRDYWAAARHADGLLRSGTVTLPEMLEF
ncbi:site-specific integrase [Pseudorhizobium marinum]|uniref:hypothetical protein n=1 Tax=Pseudorhizobium marinum TaxID=1496690 RepID=UPI000495C549|nr:hypothetical protein [Pseudorhizobium marinum]